MPLIVAHHFAKRGTLTSGTNSHGRTSQSFGRRLSRTKAWQTEPQFSCQAVKRLIRSASWALYKISHRKMPGFLKSQTTASQYQCGPLPSGLSDWFSCTQHSVFTNSARSTRSSSQRCSHNSPWEKPCSFLQRRAFSLRTAGHQLQYFVRNHVRAPCPGIAYFDISGVTLAA